MNTLHVSLLHEDGFRKVKNDYDKSAHYSVCDEYGL